VRYKKCAYKHGNMMKYKNNRQMIYPGYSKCILISLTLRLLEAVYNNLVGMLSLIITYKALYKDYITVESF
jgi:hypothetical protein